jgi:hypothetical protein
MAAAVGAKDMIASWTAGAADDNMDEAILVDLAGLVARHP